MPTCFLQHVTMSDRKILTDAARLSVFAVVLLVVRAFLEEGALIKLHTIDVIFQNSLIKELIDRDAAIILYEIVAFRIEEASKLNGEIASWIWIFFAARHKHAVAREMVITPAWSTLQLWQQQVDDTVTTLSLP